VLAVTCTCDDYHIGRGADISAARNFSNSQVRPEVTDLLSLACGVFGKMADECLGAANSYRMMALTSCFLVGTNRLEPDLCEDNPG
jgi:hypothetical protein